MTEDVRHIHIQENPPFQSSIDIGTPGKRGNLKVYFNPLKPDESKVILTNAYALLEEARKLMCE
jgi:hypothetical protein